MHPDDRPRAEGLAPDALVDALLDAAASGINTIERDGVSSQHAARFVLIGSGNPEEGELRPQLLDRFALSVEIRGIREARERVLIMQRNLAYKLAQHPQMQLHFSPWVVQRYEVYCAYSSHLPIPAERLDALLLELRDERMIDQWLDEAVRSAADRPAPLSAGAR